MNSSVKKVRINKQPGRFLSDNIVRYQIRLLSFYSSTGVLSAKHAPVIACDRKLPKDVDRVREI